MSRELMLLRHAKSSWDDLEKTDFDRPLAPRGKRDAKTMGSWMRAQGYLPRMIFSSDSMRTRQTLKRLLAAAKAEDINVSFEHDIYMAAPETILSLLEELPKEPCVMVVGHNPAMEMIVSYLCNDQSQLEHYENIMPTAALARFELPDDWSNLSASSGRLLSLTHPKSLTTL